MFKVMSLIASSCQLPPEFIEAARVVSRRPKVMLAVMREVPPLPKESLGDPDIFFAYPEAFIRWSLCMHGIADWEGPPVLSYADYVAQMSYAFHPTDVALPGTELA